VGPHPLPPIRFPIHRPTFRSAKPNDRQTVARNKAQAAVQKPPAPAEVLRTWLGMERDLRTWSE
jgi:hypothetical protein